MKKAFTLIEIQVSLAIFIVLAAGLYQVLDVGMTAYTIDNNTLTLRQELRRSMDSFVREVRECRSHVVMKTDDNNDKISFNTFDKSGVEYYNDAGRFSRRYPVTTVRLLAPHMTRFKLSLKDHLLRVEMQAGDLFFRKMIVVSLTEDVRLRNE